MATAGMMIPVMGTRIEGKSEAVMYLSLLGNTADRAKFTVNGGLNV